jgi:hypothetical protein
MGIDIVGIIGNSFQTLYKNKAVLILVIISTLLSTVSYMLFSSQSQPTSLYSTPQTPSTVALVGVIVISFISLLLSGSVISAVAAGSSGSIGQAIGKAANRYVHFLALGIATGELLIMPIIIIGISFALWYVGGMYGAVSGSGIITAVTIVLGLIGLLIGIYFGLGFALAATDCIVGGNGPLVSLHNSWVKTRGNFWGIFFTYLALGVILIIITIVLYFAVWTVKPLFMFIITFLSSTLSIATVLIYKSLSGSSAQGGAAKVGIVT